MHAHQLPATHNKPFSAYIPSQLSVTRSKAGIVQKALTKQRHPSFPTARRHQVVSATSGAELPTVTQPFSIHDVDRELWMVLDLASDSELEGVHDMLFGEQSWSWLDTLYNAACTVLLIPASQEQASDQMQVQVF